MTKPDALFNTMEALRVHRMIHKNEPAFIRVRCGDAGVAECVSGWSKSTINNNAQMVFLILPQSDDVAAKLPHAETIEWGEIEFTVTDRKEPDEVGSYWMLSARQA